MDTLSFPLPNRLLLVIAPNAAHETMLSLSARLAAQGTLRVLDGGNHFNVYAVARSIRRQTGDLTAALQRIRVARAFTCYQMAAMLADTPADTTPALLFDLLSSFYDENVNLRESFRLLQGCLDDIRRLSAAAPVIASVRSSGPLFEERRCLVEALQAAARQVWEQPALLQPPTQPALF